MDKSTYLKQLEAALRERYPEPQVQDILVDYEDFFATGAAEGKSEAQLCAEFGPPEQAASELKSESETEIPQRGKMRSALAVSILAILIFAILWSFFGPRFERVPGHTFPDGPVNFWLAMLFPLVLEGILALWASQKIPRKKSLNWIPRVGIVFAVLITAVLALLVFYTFWIPQGVESFATEGLFGTTHVLMAIVSRGTTFSEILLLVLVVLLMLFAIRGHKKAHWFLFLDTALLTLFLNLASFLSSIGAEYNPISGVMSCFFWAILPNLAAMGIYWIIQKVISIWRPREAKAWTGK